jgi:beta-lactamase regulating signal transducer with metallopeptidase domain
VSAWLESHAVELIAKVTLVLVLAGLGAVVLSRRSAALRHLVWVFGFAATVVLPALIWLPGLSLPAPLSEGTPVGLILVNPAGAVPVAFPWLALWSAGFLAVMVWWGVGAARAVRLVRDADEVVDDRLAQRLGRHAHRLDVGRGLRIVESGETSVPLVWGVAHPVIVLPLAWREWSDHLLSSVLLHEVAHVARLDLLTRWMAGVAVALYWFHPLAWLAQARLRFEGELACDALAAEHGSGAERYAEHLVEIALRGARRMTPFEAPAMARTTGLGTRVRHLLRDRRSGADPRPAAVAAVMLFLVGCIAATDVRPEEQSTIRATAVETPRGGVVRVAPVGQYRAVPETTMVYTAGGTAAIREVPGGMGQYRAAPETTMVYRAGGTATIRELGGADQAVGGVLRSVGTGRATFRRERLP